MDRRQARRQGICLRGLAFEVGAQLRQTMLLALLPTGRVDPLAAQQRQRVVAQGTLQPGDVLAGIARQDYLEGQQGERGGEHPGDRVVGEVERRIVHGIVCRSQRIEGHQVGQAGQRVAGHAGGIDAWQPEQRQGDDQQGKAVHLRQHAEGAQGGGRHGQQRAFEELAGPRGRIGGGGQQCAIRAQHQQHHVAVVPAGPEPEQAGQHDGRHRAQPILQRAGVVAVKAHRRTARRRPWPCQRGQAVERDPIGVQLFAQPVGSDEHGRLVVSIGQAQRRQRFGQALVGVVQDSRGQRGVVIGHGAGGVFPGLAQRRLQGGQCTVLRRRRQVTRDGRGQDCHANVGQRRHAAHQGAEQCSHAVADRGSALRQVFGFSFARGQQIVHAIDVGEQVLPRLPGISGGRTLLTGDHASHRGGQAGVLRLQCGAQAAPAGQAADQTQADDADDHGRAAAHHVFKGGLGVAHGAISGQPDGVARHHRAGRAKVAQQCHGGDAQAQPRTEAQDEQQGHLAGNRHQAHGGQHARQRADDAPGALADDGALHGVDDQQHGGRGRVGRFQFQQVGHPQRQRGGGDRARDIGAARSGGIEAGQGRQYAAGPGAWRVRGRCRRARHVPIAPEKWR
ncbi:hypothetical protein LMG3412_04357 [Achromobacter deleyi]|nr:hypothetical protein LMG3412_04357 [Achromobacter deleyi]